MSHFDQEMPGCTVSNFGQIYTHSIRIHDIIRHVYRMKGFKKKKERKKEKYRKLFIEKLIKGFKNSPPPPPPPLVVVVILLPLRFDSEVIGL